MNITRLNIKKEKLPLSKTQKAFNRLNNRINKLRSSIESVPAKMDKIRQFHVNTLAPLNEKLVEVKYLTIKQMDYLLATAKFGKRQRETLLDLFIDELEDIHDIINRDDPRYDELLELHQSCMKDIHGEKEFEKMEAEQEEQAKRMAEMMFGINLDGIDLKLDNPEDEELLNERLNERMKELEEEQETLNRRNTKRQSARKPSPREEAKKQEDNDSLKTLREVYTDLVKKLHPDREKDETLRLEKTEQMKQVTEAYERKDLATLLLMQINWLQRTDKDPMAQSDEVLTRYNNVLKMHIDKLEIEYRQMMWSPMPFDIAGLNMSSVLGSDIRQLDYYFSRTKKELKTEIKQAEDLFTKVHTPESMKQFIKELNESNKWNKNSYDFLDEFFNEFN